MILVYDDNINNKNNIKKIIGISFIVDNFDKRLYEKVYCYIIKIVY